MKRSLPTLAALTPLVRTLLRGRFKRVTLAALMLLLVFVLAASANLSGVQHTAPGLAGGASQANRPSGASAKPGTPYRPATVNTLANGGKVSQSVRSDVSPPLRSIEPNPPAPVPGRESEVENGLPPMGPQTPMLDPVVQRFLGPLAMPTPSRSFQGMYNYWGVSPPDPDGDVGPDHYVQMVNTGFQIYDKSGNVLYGPANINTLWAGFGGDCEKRNDGDPIVMYDQLADRWMLSQFTTASPWYECIAVSTSPDPIGSYYRYAFEVGQNANFEDYPHFGVWPDGYYMTANEFANNAANTGAGIFAFDRAKMLVGDSTASMIYFHLNLPYVGLLPSDLEGYTPPPAGSPNYILGLQRQSGNQLHMYKFDVQTWTPPAAALEGPYPISVAPWDEDLCPASREACIPQPAGAPALEAISDRLMYRLSYRNFGDHESLIANHTVDAASNGVAGIRWYEIRGMSAISPTLYQEGTFAPSDGVNRWMGSIAMDRLGDIALGYSASNTSTVYPSIRYTGRVYSDTLGQLPQGEGELVAGTGVQTGSARWGDYTSLHVDPDECTFWYTNEYYDATSFNGWRTRIGSFNFPNCAPVCGVASVINGSITMSDTTQTSAVVGGIASSCNTTQTCPGMSSFPNPRHYDSYTFTNTSGSPQCVTVSLDATGCGNGGVASVAYLNSFNPSSVCSNYLASAPAGPNVSYSFKVPAGATYVIVVRETNIDAGCAGYTLRVNPSCGNAPDITDTPTATGTSTTGPTSTDTATVTATSIVTGTATSTATAAVSTNTSTATPSSTSTVVASTSTATTAAPSATSTTAANTNTATRTATTAANTSTATRTSTRTATRTATPNATATACAIKFADVPPVGEGSTFYGFVRCLACRHIVSGYPCGGPGEPCNGTHDPYYRPNSNVTRGQLSKIVALSAGLSYVVPTGRQSFHDVVAGDPFYTYIEQLAQTGAITGYPCNSTDPQNREFLPCDAQNHPWFRPNNLATRGQISKIVSIAAGFVENIPADRQTFTDVPHNSPFWVYIERLAARNIINGYNTADKCPSGVPCFRYNDNTTRGQMAKIDANSFFPNCQTPAKP